MPHEQPKGFQLSIMRARQISFFFLMLGSSSLYVVDPFLRITAKNLLPSDVCFVASAIALFFSFPNFLAWEKELWNYPGLTPFILYLCAATFGFMVTAIRTRAVPEFHVFSVLQLGFILLVLCPTILANKREYSNTQKLWLVPMCLIPLAGILSLTDVLGLTNLGDQFGDRHYNVILPANGFALFTAVSAFLLQKMFPFRLATILYTTLWVLACAGTILSGTKAAIAVVALSVVFVLWINRHDIVASKRYLASAVLLLALTLGGGMSVVSAMPELFGRFQKMADFFETGADDYSASLRQDQLKVLVRDLSTKPVLWLGTGLKQYRVIHPEDEIETIHDMYLQQLYESGLLGLIAFVSIFALCIGKAHRCYRRALRTEDREGAKYWACCWFAISAYLLIGFVYPLGYDRQFWILLLLATPSHAEYNRLANHAGGLSQTAA
jgi:O-antigen ligase